MTELSARLNNISIAENDHEHFMSLALISAQRSKDPCTQVGACIVDGNGKVVGLGYNGMPWGCPDNTFPWGKHNEDPLKNKFLYVCHAELNAISNSTRRVKDCTIYVTLFPCNECAKLIIQNGIVEVIYLSAKNLKKPSTTASKLMFDSAGVKYWKFQPRGDYTKIKIDFSNSIN